MKFVIALGGNALGDNPAEQQKNIKKTVKQLLPLLSNHQVIITHGNGPQVGMIDLAFEDSYEDESIPHMPLTESVAMSQGYIGFHLEKSIRYEFKLQNINKQVAALITEIEVDKNDPAFKRPTKPIGSFYDKEMADYYKEKYHQLFVEDSGHGYRKVVASPMPKKIPALETIKLLLKNNHTIICCGGGGIPISTTNIEEGINGVIDKDQVSALLAKEINADALVILTTVDQVFINYNQPTQKALSKVSVSELEAYIKDNQFAEGSMLPKIEACISFVKGSKKKAYITSLKNLKNINDVSTIIYDH